MKRTIYLDTRECSVGDYQDFIENVRHSEHKNLLCVITGTLGLWDGRHEIHPEFSTLSRAILKCLDNNDYKKVETTQGSIKVYQMHHDGVNEFIIKVLSDKGVERYNKHLEDGTAFNVKNQHNFTGKKIEYLF